MSAFSLLPKPWPWRSSQWYWAIWWPRCSAAFLSGTTFWEGITVNYSSMAGVAAMLLVIAVVLISVIYPSRVAARIAIPDVNRTFELPEPVE